MTDLSKSVENIRLAAAMEAEHMRPALVYAMALETAHMPEADVLQLIRQARQNLSISEEEEVAAPPAPARSRPRARRTTVVA